MPEMLGVLILIRFVSSKNACLINSFPSRERQTIITPWIIRQNGNTPQYACAQQDILSLVLPVVLISIVTATMVHTKLCYLLQWKESLINRT